MRHLSVLLVLLGLAALPARAARVVFGGPVDSEAIRQCKTITDNPIPLGANPNANAIRAAVARILNGSAHCTGVHTPDQCCTALKEGTCPAYDFGTATKATLDDAFCGDFNRAQSEAQQVCITVLQLANVRGVVQFDEFTRVDCTGGVWFTVECDQ